MELKQLKDLVTETLKQGESFRENDDMLYLTICIKLFSDRGSITNMTVADFFTNRKKYGLPTYESVSRCRRKAQEENPALRPCEAIQKGREIQQDRFYNFATKQGEFSF